MLREVPKLITKKRINLISILVIILPILFYNLQNLNDDIVIKGDLHFYYVIFSSIIAILVGFASFLEYKKNKVEKIFYISIGFIGVGIFYSFHALVTPKMTFGSFFEFPSMISNINAFVFFGDLCRFWLAIMMFIPDNISQNYPRVKKYFNAYTLFILFAIFSMFSYILLSTPDRIPIFKNDDLTDTNIAILTKVITLLFLGINALKYYYSYKAKQNITILSFIVGLCLIMETVVIFMISKPWSSGWWLAHNLFLLSYLVIGLGVLYSFYDKQKYEYFDVLGQINTYTKLLEEKNKELSQLASTDTLTGLANRSHFFKITDEYLQNAKKENISFAILFIDLDFFKEVNDKYGHHIGDELLKIVSKKIKSIIKKDDLAGRIGGDEFLILLKEVSQKEAIQVSSRILERLAHPINIDGNNCKVGSSIGISIFPSSGKTLDELISKSDEAMYKVKKEGRNNYMIC